MKKLLLLFAVLATAISASASDFKSGMFYYKVLSEENLTVELVSDEAMRKEDYHLKEVNIPGTVSNNGKTYTVTRIGDNAFEYFSNYEEYTMSLPNTITSIGERAFEHQMLVDIIIPESVKEIGANPFPVDSYLPIRNQMVYAGSYLVRYEPRLYDEEKESYVYYDEVKGEKVYYDRKIQRYVYYYDKQQVEIVENEPKELFDTSEELVIRPGTRFIGTLALDNINMLSEIVPDKAPHTRIVLPGSVEVIGRGAFGHGMYIEEVDLGGNVRVIDKYAFLECPDLRRVYNSNNVEEIRTEAFLGCRGLNSISLPKVKKIGDRAFSGCNNLWEFNWGDCIEEIGESAFYDCWPLEISKFPESLKEIKVYAFVNCYGLRNIVLPNSLTGINDCVFSDCRNLQSVKLGNAVEYIGNSAFYGTELKEIHLPATVKYVGQSAFSHLRTLQTITIDAQTPPEAYETELISGTNHYLYDSFSDATYENATLVVPDGTEHLYKEAKCWRKFQHRVNTGIGSVSATTIVGKTYNLNGMEEGDDYKGIVIQNGKKVLRK